MSFCGLLLILYRQRRNCLANIEKYSITLPQENEALRSCSAKHINHDSTRISQNQSTSKYILVFGHLHQGVVTGDDWGCITRDLEKIIVLMLLACISPSTVTRLTIFANCKVNHNCIYINFHSRVESATLSLGVWTNPIISITKDVIK